MINKAILYVIMCVIVVTMTVTCSAEEHSSLAEIDQFLINDTTDTREHLEYYSCGHFTRDLARNASKQNLSIGSVILSNHPVFRGMWNSHIVNYVMVNETIVIIDPQTDSIFGMNPGMMFDGKFFKYYRLYPDGTQVPSYWIHNLAHTGKIE